MSQYQYYQEQLLSVQCSDSLDISWCLILSSWELTTASWFHQRLADQQMTRTTAGKRKKKHEWGHLATLGGTPSVMVWPMNVIWLHSLQGEVCMSKREVHCTILHSGMLYRYSNLSHELVTWLWSRPQSAMTTCNTESKPQIIILHIHISSGRPHCSLSQFKWLLYTTNYKSNRLNFASLGNNFGYLTIITSVALLTVLLWNHMFLQCKQGGQSLS